MEEGAGSSHHSACMAAVPSQKAPETEPATSACAT